MLLVPLRAQTIVWKDRKFMRITSLNFRTLLAMTKYHFLGVIVIAVCELTARYSAHRPFIF